jgi:hypothetical protein
MALVWAMQFSRNTRQRSLILGYLAAWFLMAAGLGRAQEFRLESAGARGGFSSDPGIGQFVQAEAFLDWNLPWQWEWGTDWRLQSRLDLSAGWLGSQGTDAAIATIGPTVVLGRKRFPLSLEGGLSPTVLSRHEFESKDFGSLYQFTSHAGLNWDLGERFRVGYRFQHMSNAGFASPNPGLNMHLFTVSYRF